MPPLWCRSAGPPAGCACNCHFYWHLNCQNNGISLSGHYRDRDNLEVDPIIERPDGTWAAAEVKLGGAADVDRGARTLRRLRDKLDRARTRDPARLIVITAGGYAYERPDGVCVVPITALGP